MKISIIGAGNVGGLTAMRLAQEGLGEIVLYDILKGLAIGKALDMEDSRNLTGSETLIIGTDDINQIRDSSIVVITAGLARKPGMTREELLTKNGQILKEITGHIRRLAPCAIVIVVTNPLDAMTYLALKATDFEAQKVIGMGISLDAARFANLISRELRIPVTEIEACVIGSHGEGMIPLPRLTRVKGVSLEEFFDEAKLKELIERTVKRGAEIVSHLGSGSAYFAPSAAIASLVKAIARDEKRIMGACACLDGQYGIKDICIGVPCRIGARGIENIIEIELRQDELTAFLNSVDSIRKSHKLLDNLIF